MKKRTILNLIKFHVEDNDAAFRENANEIAQDFFASGDQQLAEYIMSILSNANTFVPQGNELSSQFIKKVVTTNAPLPLPDSINDDVMGIMNAIPHNMGVNRFLFEGSPGTGKTETVKHVARILKRDLFQVNTDELIDSRLGETAKHISELFEEINALSQPDQAIILIDELDALALERTGKNDVREMGRATTAVLKGLDSLNDQVVLIATTNLYSAFDKAVLRRFNSVIDFNRYSQDDLRDIAQIILNSALNRLPEIGRNTRLFTKILSSITTLPYPGDLKNLIETSIAFSDPDDKFDYLARFYKKVTQNDPKNLTQLKSLGFTLREIETLSGVPRSTIDRVLKEDTNE